MKWGEFVEQADEILLARKLNRYMGIENEAPTRLTADERARQYADLKDDEERKLAEALDVATGVEHEPRRPLARGDYAGLSGAEVVLAMEYDEWAGGWR